MDKKEITEKELRVWEKSIDTQVHFNDLIMRNRTIVVSFVTAIFGAAAYSLKDSNLILKIGTKDIHVAVAIILFGIFFLVAYAYLDLKYYLSLLIGAVKFTEEMDDKCEELGLTKSISNEIAHKRSRKVLLTHYAVLVLGAIVAMISIFCLQSNVDKKLSNSSQNKSQIVSEK